MHYCNDKFKATLYSNCSQNNTVKYILQATIPVIFLWMKGTVASVQNGMISHLVRLIIIMLVFSFISFVITASFFVKYAKLSVSIYFNTDKNYLEFLLAFSGRQFKLCTLIYGMFCHQTLCNRGGLTLCPPTSNKSDLNCYSS